MIVFTPLISKAIEVATFAHYGQKRKSGSPFIIHPLSVALIISRVSPEDENLICAGLLHDTVEDSKGSRKVTLDNIMEIFGLDIYELVKSVTEEQKKEAWDVRKRNGLSRISKMTDRQAILKCADIIHNNTSYIDFLTNKDSRALDSFSKGPEESVRQKIKELERLRKVHPFNPLLKDLEEQVEILVSLLPKS